MRSIKLPFLIILWKTIYDYIYIILYLCNVSKSELTNIKMSKNIENSKKKHWFLI